VFINRACCSWVVGILVLEDTLPALGKAGHLDAKATWVTLRIPQNAHIIYSDNGWECNKSYPKRKNKCILRKWHAIWLIADYIMGTQ